MQHVAEGGATQDQGADLVLGRGRGRALGRIQHRHLAQAGPGRGLAQGLRLLVPVEDPGPHMPRQQEEDFVGAFPLAAKGRLRGKGLDSRRLGETLTELAGDEEQWLLRAAVQSLPGTPKKAAPNAPLPILDTLILLHGVPLFAQLDPDDLEVLAGAARVHTFAPEATLCRQGERSDEVFLLLSGRVRTWILDREQRAQILGEATTGACLGEMAVLDAAPRSATVTAQDEVRALVLGGAAFREVLHAQPAVAEGVLRVLTQRLRALIQAPQAS